MAVLRASGTNNVETMPTSTMPTGKLADINASVAHVSMMTPLEDAAEGHPLDLQSLVEAGAPESHDERHDSAYESRQQKQGHQVADRQQRRVVEGIDEFFLKPQTGSGRLGQRPTRSSEERRKAQNPPSRRQELPIREYQKHQAGGNSEDERPCAHPVGQLPSKVAGLVEEVAIMITR